MGSLARSNRWVDSHAFAIDAFGVVPLLLICVPVTGAMAGSSSYAHPAWIAPLLAAAIIVPLAWRRTRPVASVVTIYLVGLTQVLAGYPVIGLADFAVLFALYSVTVHGPRWAHRTAIAGALAGSVLTAVATGISKSEATGILLVTGISALAVWAFGLVRRSRHEILTALRDRAERLEVERDQQARLATSTERARIAREMHDIVAHSLSVIIAQADGGQYAAREDPGAASQALGTIADTGRLALADMRRLLGVLRVGDDDATPTGLVPQPTVGDVEQLVEQVRGSGLRVSFARVGTARILPPGAGLVAYRICQESLTNVLKHAGPDPTVTVLMHWLPTALILEVSDNGRGAAAAKGSDGRGQGLLGMHERAAMFEGSVIAGPRAGGGFRVRVNLPLLAQP